MKDGKVSESKHIIYSKPAKPVCGLVWFSQKYKVAFAHVGTGPASELQFAKWGMSAFKLRVWGSSLEFNFTLADLPSSLCWTLFQYCPVEGLSSFWAFTMSDGQMELDRARHNSLWEKNRQKKEKRERARECENSFFFSKLNKHSSACFSVVYKYEYV